MAEEGTCAIEVDLPPPSCPRPKCCLQGLASSRHCRPTIQRIIAHVSPSAAKRQQEGEAALHDSLSGADYSYSHGECGSDYKQKR